MILISHIRQFLFCPRIFYFYNFTDIKPAYPDYVSFGTEFHNKQNELFKSRKFQKLGINFIKAYNNFYLEDENMSGICDLLLECESEIIVAEFKNQNKPILNKGAKMQLIAYSKLASAHFKKPFHRVILCYANNLKFKIFEISQADLYEFEQILIQIKTIMKNENFPQSSANQAACGQCEFKNFCDDRE